MAKAAIGQTLQISEAVNGIAGLFQKCGGRLWVLCRGTDCRTREEQGPFLFIGTNVFSELSSAP